jgi:transcription elongation GreA/GreB family factor
VSNFKFSDDDADKLAALFARVAVPRAQNDNVTLAEAIAMLVGYMDKTMLAKVLEPLKRKALFWPVSLESVNLDDLEVWGKIPVKSMPEFIKACECVFPTEYLSRYATLLPLRCLNLFCEHMDDELLTRAILETRDCGSDILLWIWRNRKTHSEHLSSMVNIKNVVAALSQGNLPASRSSAQRELKKQLIDKRDFQEHLIDCEDDVVEIVYALQGARFFMPGEQQSLLVKLSRVSDELRNLLASGQGKRLMSGGRGGDESQGSELPPQPTITSVRSHRALIKELDDIVRIHIPENRESLKVARAHGDFRENSEYDAAKERRNFLSNRRNELEHEISSIQPINFRNITVEDRIIIGSSVDFVYDNGKQETFHILGAWDGEPERNWLSYKTRLGEMLMGRKVGDKLEMPDGRKATVKSVYGLPAEIVEILADGE